MTKTAIKRIGVMTSGGDCAGLNAAIRAVTFRAIQEYGWEVVGIREGTHGLMQRPPLTEELSLKLFTGNILRMGGTILGTVNKGDPFAFPQEDGTVKDRSDECLEGIRLLGLDALIGIGGDGSMKILNRLAEKGGFPFAGIPKTIDNDVAGTDYAVGFNTAVGSAVDALDRLQPTAASHQRVMILEVMGRDAGHIALTAGIAGGADVILIPEIPYDAEAVADKIRRLSESGRNHALVVCSEAISSASSGTVMHQAETGGMQRYGGVSHILGEEITRLTGAETRVTVLGHVQRGGIPVGRDRVIASAYGVHAVDLIAVGNSGKMAAWRNGQVTEIPLREVVSRTHLVDVDGPLIKIARGLDICLGDSL